MNKGIIDTYNRESNKLIEQYESKTFEEVHQFALEFIPKESSAVLDIGAGSGRDAAWFASKGHQVVAVEPAIDLRTKAEAIHPSPSIKWFDDSLPNLTNTLKLGQKFDLIWLSAVWMHLPQSQRESCFSHLVSLLKPTGRIMISLRHGDPPKNRKVYEVSVEELQKFAEEMGVKVVGVQDAEDTYEREGVWWQTVLIEKSG